mmetsp:Transcript_2699/g.4570  ORF Transcript_2699/g.4570 Transcript_2699/m.4570 type:complete len:92 (+) Transcript_2699:2070-2345(+)
MANEGRTQCVPKDVILDQHLNLINMFRVLRFDLFCSDTENAHLCDREVNRFIGPIRYNPEDKQDRAQPLFFFANNEALRTERFEFHKSKLS